MERLVREELERWDSEASMNRESSPSGSRAATAKSSRGSPSRASQASAGSTRTQVSIFFILKISIPLTDFHKYFFNVSLENYVAHQDDKLVDGFLHSHLCLLDSVVIPLGEIKILSFYLYRTAIVTEFPLCSTNILTSSSHGWNHLLLRELSRK